MAANRMSVCPRCYANVDLELDWIEAQLEEGKFTAHTRLSMLESMVYGDDMPRDLREDFEIGMDTRGKLSLRYNGYCYKCGFKAEFEMTKEFDVVYH